MNKADLRVIKTREALMNALTELTVEKAYSSITVQDICKRALINRSTFYRHYEDKNDLLERYMIELFENFKSLAPEPGSRELKEAGDDDLLHLTAFYSLIQKHSNFFRIVLGEEGLLSFRKMLIDYMSFSTEQKLSRIAENGMIDGIPISLIAAYQAHAALGVVEWRLSGKENFTPAQTARIHLKLIRGSLSIT